MQILLCVIVICAPFVIMLRKIAKEVADKERDTFIFSAKNYENKELFHALLSRGIKTLSLSLGNNFLIVTMCFLLQNVKFYFFAGLFVLTTCILWYSNMYYSLERARTLPETNENEG